MICPRCAATKDDIYVKATMPVKGQPKTRRHWRCRKCGGRFKTTETVDVSAGSEKKVA